MRFPVLLTGLMITATPVFAGEWLEWQSNNIQLLNGTGIELTDHNRQTTFTYEHVDSWKYGDNFFYVDAVLENLDESNAEFSPRLSLGKISGHDLSVGIFKDILLTGTWEKARNFDTYLYGVGLDLELPGFNFFQTNFYRRDNPDAPGHGWQNTTAWSLPFAAGRLKFSFDGYFDYADYEEGTQNFSSQPQLLLDIGDALGVAEEGKAWVGIEYRYWHNKYGIDGLTEKVPQAMVKWVF